ncbi:MAG: GGDEF domain-containing protein [Wenzhouxiangellaceae bacterium]|nr:GGDEF domain-containing protein [Wenzhouxiangellaceae bacterium]
MTVAAIDQQTLDMLATLSRLTRQRDLDELDRALVDALSCWIEPGTSVRFHRPLALSHPAGDPPKIGVIRAARTPCGTTIETAREILHQPVDDALARALAGELAGPSRCCSHDCAPGQRRWLFPVAHRARANAVLEFVRQRKDPATDPFVTTVVDVYRNQLALLDEMQRDVLTGLLNRQTFDRHLSEILERSQRAPGTDSGQTDDRRRFDAEGSSWLGVLDIDHFKRVNDRFGHLYGDEVLILFARLMQQNFRDSDLLFRYGGEEFIVLLAPCSRDDAIAAFERFRRQVREHHFPQVDSVTVSAGLVEIGNQSSPSEMVGQADQALYEAKDQGRDRVCEYQELVRLKRIRPPEAAPDVDLDLF